MSSVKAIESSSSDLPSAQQQLLRTYRAYAPVYDLLFGGILADGRRRVAEHVAKEAPRTLLEVGVGTGLSLPLYPPATEVTGVDLSEEMLSRARRRAAALPGRVINLLRMNAENLALPSGTFDCVVLCYVLSVTPDIERLVREVCRVCARGGTILILNHFEGSPFWRPFERAISGLTSRIGFKPGLSFADSIEKYDWRVRSVTTTNILSLSKLVVIENG